MALIDSDQLEVTGFGDGDLGMGDAFGGGCGYDQALYDMELDMPPVRKPTHVNVATGDGYGFGAIGTRCPTHQLTTTRSFDGHLVNIFIRGLSS